MGWGRDLYVVVLNLDERNMFPLQLRRQHKKTRSTTLSLAHDMGLFFVSLTAHSAQWLSQHPWIRYTDWSLFEIYFYWHILFIFNSYHIFINIIINMYINLSMQLLTHITHAIRYFPKIPEDINKQEAAKRCSFLLLNIFQSCEATISVSSN